MSDGVHGMYVEDRAVTTQLVYDTRNRGFPAFVFNVLNGNQNRVLIGTYFFMIIGNHYDSTAVLE